MKRQTHGFTLVELLVVIAIIATLISLLLPALNKARFSAGQIQCLSNVRQLAQAASMYCGENGGFYPYYDGTGDQHWTTQLFGFVNKSAKVFECPLVTDFIDAPLGGSLGVVGGSGINNNTTRYTVPTGGTPYTAHLCYKCNGTGIFATTKNKVVGYPFGDVYDQGTGTTITRLSVNGVLVPRTMRFSSVAPDTVLIFDGFTQTATFGDRSAEHFGGPSGGGDPSNFDYRSIGIQSHLGKSASMAFADYHAETVATGTLLQDALYDVNTSPNTYVPTNTSNLGRAGDLQIKSWNGSSAPYGHWSGNDGD